MSTTVWLCRRVVNRRHRVLTIPVDRRQLALRSLSTTRTSSTSLIPVQPDPSLVDARNAPIDFTSDCAVVYRDFLTPQEGELLTKDILARMKRRRYEKGHWDAVITQYKEVELADIAVSLGGDSLNEQQQQQQQQQQQEEDEKGKISSIFRRVQRHLEESHFVTTPSSPPPNIQWLPCHAIDLKQQGELNAHVDSVKFSGDLVAGISLLSSCIMRLEVSNDDDDDDGNDNDGGNGDGNINREINDQNGSQGEDQDQGHVDLLLPPLSLYALTGVGRYRYSHQLLPDQSTFIRNSSARISSSTSTTPEGTEDATVPIVVHRDQRLSIIFRDAKRE